MITKPSAVAIVHYHLRRGGVARVIQTDSQCLRKAGVPHVVLSGMELRHPGKLPVGYVPELAYDSSRHASVTTLGIVQRLRRAAREHLGTERVIWHLHNHSVGKSRAISEAAGILAEAGDPLVLQYHDFAEDGRPANYPVVADIETLYPSAPQVVHAFINSRDRRYLIEAGMPETQCVLHPNAITQPARPDPDPGPGESPLVLYPVRGIRRKNLGELFLLAALAPAGTRFAVSLAPENPRWHTIHDEWVAFASDTGLPVILDAVGRVAPRSGAPKTFASWVRHSSHFITTSIAEGFGLGFLEPATLGKPLFGRNLPMVTDDFAAVGIVPGRLYDRLLVPESWVGLETLRQRLVRSLRDTLERYDQPMSNQHLERSFAAIRHQGHVDFGNLPEDLQRQVIHRIIGGSGQTKILAERGGETLPLRTWLKRTLAISEPTVSAEQLVPYSREAHLKQLESLYHQATTATAETPFYIPKHKVLNRFTQPGSFHFLRT